ncbi:SDR family NAD(P)-dependent oxidoreductase [Streptomyces hawaiiensis]|uniref:SDR family NAD(P)-dependent oxidoreductase n=1 Tax=Streptomyces hawaiiensis TaxID=67305 RepID=UPI003667482B
MASAHASKGSGWSCARVADVDHAGRSSAANGRSRSGRAAGIQAPTGCARAQFRGVSEARRRDLSSLKTAADRLDLDRLDAVVYNVGVALDDPPRRETVDGHELMFGTNHLGHFALTQWLAPLLSAASAGRIVTVGSFAARSERLALDDPQSTQDYRPKRTYGRSKLAQMCFGSELDRRLRALPAGLLVQGKDAGAWPIVRAVLDPVVRGGQLWGPRVFGLRGTPRREPVPSHMTDRAVAARLWAVSSELAGTDPHLGLR